MQRARWPPGQHRVSGYRIAAFVVAIGGHIWLGLFLLRPASVWRPSIKSSDDTASALELRFIRGPHSSVPHRLVKPVSHTRRSAFAGTSPHSRLAPSQAVRLIPGRSPDSNEVQTASSRLVISTPDLRGIERNTVDDGGFAARLHAAQRADVVHGVPGSDATYAPGIHLIDPMDQGIGAVMRTTQRAFGITSRHCIDVDVWKHLSPGQLAARHISPGNVASAEAKYHCDAPLGLHF